MRLMLIVLFVIEKIISFTRPILISMLVIGALTGNAQPKLGMSPFYSFSPNDSVITGAQVNLHVYVKNKGDATFTGSLSITVAIDTLFTPVVDSVIASVTILPNDSFSRHIAFTPIIASNQFKVGGNGNTIVVWPFNTSVDIIDSSRYMLWIDAPTGIRNLNKNPFVVYPNPVIHRFSIRQSNHETFTKITIYNLMGEKTKELTFEESMDISDLSSGCYWLILHSEKKTYKQLLIKE